MELDKNVLEYFQAVGRSCNTIEFTFDKKNSFYIPLFYSAIEHCISIHVLDKQELIDSAFALARPMVENYSRAMWVKYCLDEADIEEGCEKQHFPKKLDAMLGLVSKSVASEDGFHGFKSSIEPILSNMHDFTHGGVQSIARQYGNDEYLSNHRSRKERDELLKLALLTSSLAFEKLVPFMNGTGSPVDVLAKANKLLGLKQAHQLAR